MLRRIVQRLAALLHPARAEEDLAREVAAHLALLEDEYRRRGLSGDEARRQARLALGGVDQTKERHRDERSFPWLEDLRRDVPYAIRGLRRTPGFTFAAVVTLALGIGATTAILSVVDSVLVRPLPYPESDRLVRITELAPPPDPSRPSPPRNITWPEFVEWRSRTSLSPVAALRWDPQVMVPTPRGTARLSGSLASPEWFVLLGVPAMLGRTVLPSDVAEGRSVVVLSARAWRQHFGSDPDIVGRSITLHSRISALMTGQQAEVVGVMPDGFEDPSFYSEFWIPLVIREGPGPSGAAQGAVAVYGRLPAGMSVEAASEEATLLYSAIRKAAGTPDAVVPRVMTVKPVKTEVVRPVRPALQVLLAAVACVLVIVCANIACLLLARGSSREREIAVRLALGGSRGRIVRQLLAESAVIATAGAAIGAVIGVAGIATLRALATVEAQGVFRLVFGGNLLPRAVEIQIDPRVLGMAIGLAAITCLAFGLVPALRASRADARQASSARGGRPASESRLQSVLVTAQLTMATVLLVGATLLIASFVRLADVDTGYDPNGVLAFQLVLPEDAPSLRKVETIQDILGRLRQIPGVQATGFSNAGALVGIVDRAGYFVPPGKSAEEMNQPARQPQVRSISGDYLAAMRIPLLAGRTFGAGDDAGAPPVAIVNRALVDRDFGDVDPIGSTLSWYGGGDPVMLEVIGVIDNVRHGRIQVEPTPEVILDFRQMLELRARANVPKRTQELLALGFMSVAIRTSGNPAAIVPNVRTAVSAADPDAGLDAMAPMTDLVSTSLARPRFYAALLAVFALIAAALAAIGVYGVLAYAVAQRTQEIGVRMALGAKRADVMRLVLRRGLVLAAAGIASGLVGAAGLSRYLAGLLYGVTPTDAWTYATVAVGFALVALLASWVPARRATRVDPIAALRTE